VQQAIELVEQQSDVFLQQLQRVLSKRYDEQLEFKGFVEKRPTWAKHKASCSMLFCSS
jgi:uncharacterized protein YdiU (UPF0061 family)